MVKKGVSNSRLAKITLTLISIALVLFIVEQVWAFGRQLGNIVSILAGAWFISVVVRPLIQRLSRGLLSARAIQSIHTHYGVKNAQRLALLKLPTGLAIAVAYLLLLIIIVGIVTILVTTILPQISDLLASAPEIYAQLPTWIAALWSDIARRLGINPEAITQIVNSSDFAGQVQRIATTVAQQALAVATGTASFLGQLLLAIVLSLYMTMDGKSLERQFFLLLPTRAHETTRAAMSAVGRAFSGYMRGMLFAASIEGIVATIVLSVFQVNFALALGTMYFLLSLIPLVGAPIGITTITLVTLLFQPSATLWVLGILITENVLNGYVITPRIMKDAVGVPGLLGLLSTTIGVQLFGFWGLLFSVPTIGALYELVFNFFLPRRNKAMATSSEPHRGAEVSAAENTLLNNMDTITNKTTT